VKAETFAGLMNVGIKEKSRKKELGKNELL